jgi:hypothetical protein
MITKPTKFMNLFSKNEGYMGFNSSLDSKPEIKSGIQFLTYANAQWFIFNKIFRVMKLTFILLVVLILNASAEGFSQKVTKSAEKVSLETVFTVIKKQTGYGFFFQEELFALSKPVTINASNEDLSKVLMQLSSLMVLQVIKTIFMVWDVILLQVCCMKIITLQIN